MKNNDIAATHVKSRIFNALVNLFIIREPSLVIRKQKPPPHHHHSNNSSNNDSNTPTIAATRCSETADTAVLSAALSSGWSFTPSPVLQTANLYLQERAQFGCRYIAATEPIPEYRFELVGKHLTNYIARKCQEGSRPQKADSSKQPTCTENGSLLFAGM